MKIFIICNSKTGFTGRYAEWIAAETGAVLLPYKESAQSAISPEDVVIFGSRIFGGKIEHLDKIKARFGKEQPLIVYATGATPVSVADEIEQMWKGNFTAAELAAIPHFYFQSGLNYEKMSFVERTLMKTMAKVLGKKKSQDGAESEFSRNIQSSHDISDKEYIVPLVELVKKKYGGSVRETR